MAEMTVTRDLQMKRKSFQIRSSYFTSALLSALCDTVNVKPVILSAQPRCSMSRPFSELTAMIRLHVRGRSHGKSGRKTSSLTYPHKKKKSHGVRSGDLGGQRSIAWSSATIATTFTQTAPLAAIDETKRPRLAQKHLESFSFYMWFAS
jgi:hypothetical protein